MKIINKIISGTVATATPIAAINIAGISGLSAAGVTSGLSAIAFGAGMIPGIGLTITKK